MQSMKNVLPSNEGVLYEFYDFRPHRIHEYPKEHVPDLVFIQQFCTRCEGFEDCKPDCERCGTRKHAFWDDHVGDIHTSANLGRGSDR